MEFTKQQLVKLGQSIASGWGALLEDIEVDNQNKKVNFFCDERGEKFYVSLSFGEIRNRLK